MSKQPGKKLGKLEVKLDRKKTRYKWASVNVELRFEIMHGTFHAQYDGNWYSAKTKDALTEQIKAAATKSLSLEWKRYIQLSYTAEGHPVADPRSGRPKVSGRYHSYGIDDDRSKHDDEDEKCVINSIALTWSICEISEPYALPEESTKLVRARRDVDIDEWGPNMGAERLGDPDEWDDAELPRGTFLWTPEREAFLAEIIGALGRLDRRLVELFSGDAEQLAGKIDSAAQTDPSRLLEAPPAPVPAPRHAKRRRA